MSPALHSESLQTGLLLVLTIEVVIHPLLRRLCRRITRFTTTKMIHRRHWRRAQQEVRARANTAAMSAGNEAKRRIWIVGTEPGDVA